MALALLRARMCELLGRGQDEDERDGLFTVGLLSVADALLDAPMEAVLVSLPLSDEITGALLRTRAARAHPGDRAALRAGPLPAEADANPVSWPRPTWRRCAGRTTPGAGSH